MNEQNGSPELPKGWTWASIGEIAETSSGGTPSRGNPAYYNGSIGWLKSGELKDNFIYKSQESITELGLINSSAKIFPKETLCIALYGATVGRLGILKIDTATNQAICGISLPKEISNQYLFHYLFSQRQNLIELGKGGAQPNINQEIVQNQTFPLPPLNEQARIVAKIEELFTKLDAGIEALRTVRKQLKRYRQAVLRDAVTGRLTAKWRNDAGATPNAESNAENLLQHILRERRERWETDQLAKFTAAGKTPKNDDWKNKYKEPAAPDTENLPELPNGWTRINVGLIIEDLKYGTSQKCGYENAGVPVLRIPNVSNGTISHSDLKYAELPKIEYEQLKLTSGDILLIRSNGSVSLVGKTALVRESEKDFAYAGYLIRLKPNKNFIQSNFLQIVFSSNEMRKQIEMPARSTSGVHNINSDEVKSLKLSLPPLTEQQKIVEEVERLLSVADAVEAIIEQSLKQAARLRQSILKRAFAGKLVPQDDADEPAATLLERIKLERETAGKTKKAKSARSSKRQTEIQSALPFSKQ